MTSIELSGDRFTAVHCVQIFQPLSGGVLLAVVLETFGRSPRAAASAGTLLI